MAQRDKETGEWILDVEDFEHLMKMVDELDQYEPEDAIVFVNAYPQDEKE